MTASEISLSLDADVTECGDVLTGEVSWGPIEPAPGRVLVRLLFSTSGAGSPPDSGGPAEVVFAGSTQGSERFEIDVPADGPISFAGRSISVDWEIEARFAQSGASDSIANEKVTVLPSGGLAVWVRQTAPAPTQET